MMAINRPPNTRGNVAYDVSLARYNTWGVGGQAECIFHPEDIDDLRYFLSQINPIVPITWIGLGSNVLIRDGGIEGVVIITQPGLKKITIDKDGHAIIAQAGVACAKLARVSVLNGLAGIEFLAGIPGTVGGALKMNAGAFGGQTWDQVTQVESITRHGQIVTRKACEFDYGYRYVETYKDEWFTGARFTLQPRINNRNIISIKDLLARRAESQPIGKKNCGSVFKNPESDYAARLIEECGLKGYEVGGACVSKKHANFILNEGNATASDIENLITHIRNKVLEQCDIELIPEVKFLGKTI